MPDLGGVNWPALLSPGQVIQNLPTDYYKSLENKSNLDLRQAFQNGLPQRQDGSPDYDAMARTLFQLGGAGQVGNAVSLSNLDQQRQQLALGQKAADALSKMNTPEVPVGVPPVARGDRNNNPGNIEDGRFAQSQPGYSGTEPKGRFATFKTADDGNNAAGNLIGSYGNRGINTVTGIINRWTGGNDPNAQSYIAAVSKQLGVDPNAPLDMQSPQVRQALVQAIGQFENGRKGPAASTTAIPQAGVPQSPPVQPPAIQQPQASRGNAPTGADPEIQRQINILTGIAANPALPKETREIAKARLEALQKSAEPTPDQKNYDLARRQGYKGNFQSFQSDMEANKTNASEQAKMYVKRYESIQDEGQKAFRELPQLAVVQKLMADPKFYSGAGEEYNLAFKRVLAALPGGDPNAAVPQEAFRKVVSGNILNSLSQLKGLGQIRVAEINLAKEASASTNNTPATNQILVEISKRLHEHAAAVADLAQNYNGGRLDSGFDRIVTQYNRDHPLFSDAEIQDWRKIINQPGSQQAQPSATPQEGSVIRNEKTGERRILQGGKWVPFT